MSRSGRMTAASGIGRRPATWLSCARSPSTSWAGTEHPGSACGRGASRPPGMTSTCALFWLDDFMRRPCPTSFSSVPEELIEAVRTVVEQEGGTFMRPVYESAIIQLCDDLDAGLIIETWPASRPGGAKLKKTIRLEQEIADRMNKAV